MNVQHLVINAKRSSLSPFTVDETVFVHENSATVCGNRTYLKCGAGRGGSAERIAEHTPNKEKGLISFLFGLQFRRLE
jgi:hypothetical protein